MKTLLDYRDLNNEAFRLGCLSFGKTLHGVQWAKKVFSFAGIPEKVFYQVIETEDVLLKQWLTPAEKERILDRVKKIAFITDTISGYTCRHPVYGEWKLKHGEIVGRALTLVRKKGEPLTFEGATKITLHPIDRRLFIVENGGKSGTLPVKDLTGFWSNWMADPRETPLDVDEVFK